MESFQQLEREFAEFNDLHPDNMVACSSGTSALELAVRCLDRSEWIVPEFTMIACARAVTMGGSKPVFVDCGADLNMDHDLIPWRPRLGVMAVHIYGRQCNTGGANIEDLAEAHGIRPHPVTDAACWSFYKNKVIAGEEGGAVWFREKDQAARARRLRSHGFNAEHNFIHEPCGGNHRMSNCHASLILDSLHKYRANMEKRHAREGWYYERLAPFSRGARDVPWVFDVRLERPIADQVVGYLNQNGIPARCGFKPMSRQPEYAAPYEHLRAHMESLRTLYLPLDPSISRVRIEYITDTFLRALDVLA